LIFTFTLSVTGQNAPNAQQPDMPPAVQSAAQLVASGTVGRLKRNETPAKALAFADLKADSLAAFAVAVRLAPDQGKNVGFAPAYIASVETRRTDKQLGASSRTSGSTSAASKPSIPELLGIAIDHGALAQNITGSTLTLSSSPYALIASIEGDTAQTYNRLSGYARLGVSASFNLQNPSDPLASVSRKQLAEWSASLRLFGDHSARSKTAQAKYLDMVLPKLHFTADLQTAERSAIFGSAEASTILQQFGQDLDDKLKDYLNNNAAVKTYQTSVSNKAPDANAEKQITQEISDIITTLIQQDIYNNFSQLPHDQDAVTKASDFLTRYQAATVAYSSTAKAFDEALKELENLSTMTLSYVQERSSGTPDYSVVQLIYEAKPKGFMQIDANISGSFYQKPDKTKNESTFRDFTAALSLQQNLGRSPFLTSTIDQGQMSLAFSGRYERLPENVHILGKKADIAVANFKLEIPIGSGAMTLPFSITYANASELIKEKDVRGNFGISFDLDKLFSLVHSR
jgi:hypothetical protein